MEIIDAQVHLNQLGLDACVAAMDAVGIDGAIIDQFPTSGRRLPGGAVRYDYASAEDAVRRLPSRFAYVARIDPTDPDIERLMAELRQRPGCLGIRVDQPPCAQFAEQRYAGYFTLAQQYRLPTWIVLPGRIDELAPYARAFPDLPFIVDHAGMPERWDRADPDRFAPLQALLALACQPNVAVKWGHMTKLSARPFPYDDVLAQLRRVVDAFGAERVMWESDWTMCAGHETLAEMLFSIRLSPAFSEAEKSWLLGRTARTVMRWDRPDDRIDVVAVAAADWDAFAEALAVQGRLLNGRVQILRLSPGEIRPWPAGTRCLSTAPLPGATTASVNDAALAAVSGRAERAAPADQSVIRA
jgi:predicted TIM-barrel fold metal-dependent hydrolase